jgi:putative flippase GtrA
MIARVKTLWRAFRVSHPTIAQFLVFLVVSCGVTVLQLVLMPVIKHWFGLTSLIDRSFRFGQVGSNLDSSPYYIFDYAPGALPQGGGGLAYFLAVQVTLAIAQIINFFAQRNITFKSNSSIAKAAFWYTLAYLIITLGAAALQGVYKAPYYRLLMHTWGLGTLGETIADVTTMLIASTISFLVFFPIFKVIFRPTHQPQPTHQENSPSSTAPPPPAP